MTCDSASQPTLSKKGQKKLQKQAEKDQRAAEKKATRQLDLAQAQTLADEDFASPNYGKLPLNQSQDRTPSTPRALIASLEVAPVGHHVTLRARVHTSRHTKDKVWILLRQNIELIQGFVMVTKGQVSKQMAKWIGDLTPETVVLVEGLTQKPQDGPVLSATVQNVEIFVTKLFVIAEVKKRPLPFSLEDASRAASEYEKEGLHYNKVGLDTRLDNRVLDLRTATNHSIFKIQDGVDSIFQEFLRAKGFIQIHSPKLQGAATESGASVFSVDYFKGKAFLAQSPQLAKQMAISADFDRVYEIGPVFRAENANTHRHLTEFSGLDLEMVIEDHYHEVVDLLDSLLIAIFRTLQSKYSREIEVIGRQFPAEQFLWLEGGTLKLTFTEAVDLLVQDGVPVHELDDINTENEKRLGVIVRNKYHTDYFIIDKFPLALRPFYTMPDPSNPSLSNSYDFFMRGEEILSGAQRIHDPDLLIRQMVEKGIDPESMRGYVDAFELGCPPHGGGGIGLERVVMLFLKLSNIRRASLFPRDPKRLAP